MLKDIAVKFFTEGNYNCAESLVRAANEYYGFGLHDNDMKLMGAYGGGLQCGSTCGAVLGAVAALSMKYVEEKARESETIKPVVNMFLDKVNAKYGSLLCCDIKPISYAEGRKCDPTVECICDLLEETIAEFEAGKQAVE